MIISTIKLKGATSTLRNNPTIPKSTNVTACKKKVKPKLEKIAT
jgi:hypothetical protein